MESPGLRAGRVMESWSQHLVHLLSSQEDKGRLVNVGGGLLCARDPKSKEKKVLTELPPKAGR